MTRRAASAMRDALAHLHGFALRDPVPWEDTLAERLARADVTPRSISVLVRSYGMEARRAGRRPEQMVIQLRQLYAAVQAQLGPAFRGSTRLPTTDALLTFIVSHAIDAYFTVGDADA
jgi:hypothetical protein